MKRTIISLSIFLILFLNLSFFVAQKPAKAEGLDHLIISEIQILPTEERFIELYNPNLSDVDLTGYYIQRKIKTDTSWGSLITSTNFNGKIIKSKDYFLIAKANDSADISSDFTLTDDNSLVLKKSGSVIVDKVGWGGANDPEVSSTVNFLTNQSIGRKWTNGYLDTDNNSADFEIQSPTPKAQNITYTEPEPEDPAVYSTKIYFNEIFPSPSTGDEWIEIANGDIVAVNLEGWTIEDTVGAIKVYTIYNVVIDPDGLKVFYKSDTGITLNNTGDKLILKNPDGLPVDQIEYPSISNDKSWSRKEEGVDDWTSDWPTSLGIINVAPTNRYPVANAGSNITNAKIGETLNFNGSASSDSDGSIASYDWNFGDGSIASGAQVTHSYSTAGTYQVSLVVRDDKGATSSGSITVTVVAGEITYQNNFSLDIKITEIMPDPVGIDTEGEYIKIYNFGTRDVNLRNWSIDDEDGGSKPFKIDYDLVLKSKTPATFYSVDTKITLNNTGDHARIFDPDNKLIDDITYTGPIIEGATYVLENGKWSWKNNIIQLDSDSQTTRDTVPVPAVTEDKKIPPKVETKIPDIKKIAVLEPPVVISPSLAQKDEIPVVTKISEVIISSGSLVSAKEKETAPVIQKDFVSENTATPQIVQQPIYQKPIAVLPSAAVSLLLITKTLLRPEDWKKIWEKLFENKTEIKDGFENLFK